MAQISSSKEASRLAALRGYDVLDTPRERDFDEIAELASAICGTPIAVVNLIGSGRQFFKAEVGLGVRETPLESSFCARTILEEDFLLVPDATKDPRFDCNPLVTDDPHLRFYAGALLKTAEGHPIGTVCVLDYEPRALTAVQIKALRVLARQVMNQLELRRTVRNQTLAQEAGRIGTFEIDVETNILVPSAEFCRLFGLPLAQTYASTEIEHLIVSDDVPTRSDPERRRDGSSTLDVEYRIRRADDGQLRWIARSARFVRDPSGKVTRMLGTVQDITERRLVRDELSRTSERLRLAADATRIGIFDYDLQTSVLNWDSRVRELFGAAPDEPVTYDGTFLAGLHPDDRAAADAAVQSALDPTGPGLFDIEYRVQPLDGVAQRWLTARGQSVVEDGRTIRFVGTVLDVTARRQAEDQLKGTEERYRIAARATNDAIWDWHFGTNHVLWNEALYEAYGHAPDAVDATGEWWIDHIHPDDRERISHSIHEAIAGTGQTWSDEYRFLRADGSYAVVVDRGYVIRDPSGGALRMIGAMLDITNRMAADVRKSALINLGDRLRTATTSAETVGIASEILAKTLSASRAGYSRINIKMDLYEVERDWAAPGVASLQGRRSLSIFSTTIGRLRDGQALVMADVEDADWLDADREGYRSIGTRAQIKVPMIERGELVGVLYAQQGEIRDWTSEEVEFAQGVADRTYAALGKLSAEADQRVLNQELSHRLKNNLAMVLSIANQTLRSVADREPVAAFEKRILALSSAHDVLLQQNWTAAPIDNVVHAVLAGLGHLERIDAEGPDVPLGPRATLSLSLLLHELGTNAVKYGALSAPSGRVAVGWRLVGDGDDAEVELDWSEQGGPVPVEPVRSGRKGFGSRLIRMGLAGTGGVDLRYPSSGLQVTMRAPLVQLQRS